MKYVVEVFTSEKHETLRCYDCPKIHEKFKTKREAIAFAKKEARSLELFEKEREWTVEVWRDLEKELKFVESYESVKEV